MRERVISVNVRATLAKAALMDVVDREDHAVLAHRTRARVLEVPALRYARDRGGLEARRLSRVGSVCL